MPITKTVVRKDQKWFNENVHNDLVQVDPLII